MRCHSHENKPTRTTAGAPVEDNAVRVHGQQARASFSEHRISCGSERDQ